MPKRRYRGRSDRETREAFQSRREWRAHWGSGRIVRLQPHARCRTLAYPLTIVCLHPIFRGYSVFTPADFSIGSINRSIIILQYYFTSDIYKINLKKGRLRMCRERNITGIWEILCYVRVFSLYNFYFKIHISMIRVSLLFTLSR